MKPHPSNHCKLILALLAATVALALLVPLGARANGTAYYLDVNGATPGFGAPVGTYNNKSAFWSTDATGSTAPVALATGAQLTFGASPPDFSGNTFTLDMTNVPWVGLVVNSTNANITLVGTGNAYIYYSAATVNVAGGATLTEAVTFNGFGCNFNNQNITLNGAGTINFNSCVGYNDTGQFTQNMSGGTVNLNFDWNAGTGNQATYDLLAGTLNFHTAKALNGLHSGKYFTLGGGTLDNTSGSAMTLSVGAGTPVISGNFTFNGSSGLTLPSEYFAAGNWQITVNTNTLTFGGPVTSAAGGGFTLLGGGTLALTAANTYSGGTTVSGGTLDLQNQNAAQASTVTMDGGTLVLDSAVSANAFTFGGLAASASGPGFDLALQNNAGAPIALTVGGNNGSSTYAGVLSGAGSLTVTGTGMLSLAAANTFTGNTTVNGATLDLQQLNAAQNSTVTMSGGTSALVFDSAVAGNAFNVGGLAASTSGAGYDIALQNNASAAIALTVGGNNGSATYAGTLSDAGLGSSLTKIGAGTQSLAGANTYSGATTINNGQLAGVVGGSCANSAVTVAATAGNNAALGISITDNTKQWTCPSLTINNGGSASGLQFSFGASVPPSTTIAPLNVTGGVTFSTPPFIALVAANLPLTSGNGYPLLTWGSGSAPSLTGVTLSLPSRIVGNLAIVGNTLYLKITGSTEPLSWTGGSGAWDVNDSANIIWKDVASAPTFYQQGASGDSVVFDNTVGAGGTVTLNTNVLPVNVAVNNPSADYTLTGNGAIKGSTPVSKSGAHALTLATTNTYSGGTTLSAGQLNLNTGGSSPANSAIGTGPLTIAGPSTLDNTSSGDVTLLPIIAENWNADFTYAGSAHSLNLGSGAIMLGANRQVTVSGNTLTVPGVISDGGNAYSLTKAGAGTLALQNGNNYSGPTTISAGTVNANTAGSLGTSGSTTVNGTLNLLAGAVAYTGLSTSLSGTGIVNITLGTGLAATLLNGDNSGFNGVLNVGLNAAAAAGKLQLNGVLGSGATVNVLSNATVYVAGVDQSAAITLYGGVTGENLGQLRLDAGAIWSGPVTLAGNNTGNFQGTIGANSGVNTISGNIGQTGGSWTLSKAGAGSIFLTGTNSYSGGLLVEQGSVTLYSDQSGATGGLAVGTDNYNGSTLNVGDANQTAPTLVVVAAGSSVQAGAVASGNTGYEVINAVGTDAALTTVTNKGTLFAGRNSSVIVGNDAIWVQNGLVNVQPYGGYAAALSVNNGGSFIYTGTNAIQLTENPGTTSVSSFNIGNAATTGGSLTTGQPFYYNSNSAAAGVGRITLAGGGTVVLATNIPQLTTGDSSGQFQLGNGGGVIALNGFNTTLSPGIANSGSQAGGLTITGPGTLKLTGTNSYTGDTTVSSGTLNVANPFALENSTLTMSGGNVVFDSSVTGNAFLVGGLAAGTSGLGYDLGLTNSAGAPLTLTLGTNIYGSVTYAGVLSGPGSLIQAGPGTQVLNGANTYSGNTTVNAGILEIGLPTMATNSTVTVANGALLQLDFPGTNQVGGLVLNGVSQPPGVYDATTSSTYLAGTGSLLVVPGIATNPTNLTFSVSGNTLSLGWPADHLGWLVQSNSVNLAVPADWHDLSNTATGTNYSSTIDHAKPNVFYRLRQP